MIKGATVQKYGNQKKKAKWPREWQYCKLPRSMIFSDEWKALSPAAKIIYIQMKGKYNANNNGKIRLYYSELRKVKGLSGSRTISRGFQELESKEWIMRVKIGGMYGRPNEYELIGKFDPSIGWDKLSKSGEL
jgi:hypothetical protein